MNRIEPTWGRHEIAVALGQLLSAHAIPISRQAPRSKLGYEGAKVQEDTSTPRRVSLSPKGMYESGRRT